MTQRFDCLRTFLWEEEGQDLIEYSLLITFIAIACAAIVGTTGSATTPVWTRANSQLTVANATAAGS
jgi:Flp pilus assembly pilin Flp